MAGRNSVVIFTGAGASVPLGYPTTQEFFESDAICGPWKPPDENFFKKIQQKIPRNVLDVEDFTSLLDPIQKFVGTSSGSFLASYLKGNNIPDWVTQTNDLANAINARSFAIFGRRPKELDVKDLYYPLLQKLDWETRNVFLFTTNYDLSTDVLIELAHNDEYAAYDGWDRFGNLDHAGYKNVDHGLSVYKLHGSFNWVQVDGVIKNTRHVTRTTAEHLYIPYGFKENPENMHEVYKLPHIRLREVLGDAKYLIVIGFAFRDPHLNKIFIETLSQNNELRLISVNPTPSTELESGWRDLQARFTDRVASLEEGFGNEAVNLILHAWVRDPNAALTA